MIIRGEVLFGCTFDQTSEFLAYDGPHASHDERGIGDTEGDATGTDHSGADDSGVFEPGASLFGLESIGVGFLVEELEGVGWFEFRIPLFESSLVEDLFDSLFCGDVPMVVAFRADALTAFGLFAKDRFLAAGAASPQAFRDTSFSGGGSCCSNYLCRKHRYFVGRRTAWFRSSGLPGLISVLPA